MVDLNGGAGPYGPPTALTALTVGGVPTMGMGGGIPITNGDYYFVSSTSGQPGAGARSAEDPTTSVFGSGGAYSMAAAGDVIVCLPGHAETISSATAALMTKAGVSIVGLGSGSLVPTFTLDTANTATIAVSAANQSVMGCKFVANFLSIARCFTLTATGFTLAGCQFEDTSGILNFLNIVGATGGANTVDDLTMVGNRWRGLGTTSVGSFLLSANAIDNLRFQGNTCVLATTTVAGVIQLTAGILTNLDCGYNKSYRNNATSTGGTLINVTGTTSTGIVYNNYVQSLTTGSDLLFTTSVGLAAFNNYVTGVKGASGFLIPTADS